MEAKIRAVAITVSDTRSEKNDISGETLIDCLREIEAQIIDKLIVPDDFNQISNLLIKWSSEVDLILTSGGTGFSPRDVTPEATKAIIEKAAPGLAELMRFETGKVNSKAYLSRGICGIRGNCLIINLPGSPSAVRECFSVVRPLLPHALKLIAGETKH